MEKRTKREEIVELVNRLFIYTDYQHWDKLLKEVFKDKIRFDMSSAGGGEPQTLKAVDICNNWRTGFEGIDAIHHQAGNFLVRFHGDDSAEVFCYAIASHYKKAARQGNTREFVGSYDIGVVFTDMGWRIESFKYNLKFLDGNAELK
jgi:hypothetical protein